MTFLQIVTNDAFLLVLILVLLFYHIFSQRRLEMKIINLAAEYDLLQETDEDTVQGEGNTGKTSNERIEEDFKAFQESVNEQLEENEQEVKKVIEVLRSVTFEIKGLRDAIRDRTIDLEL